MIMLKSIDLTNKCGSCDHFRQIGDTAQGECLQNPYGETVVHDPKYPYWIVARSRTKCRLYNAKPMTNADRIRSMNDEELTDAVHQVYSKLADGSMNDLSDLFCDGKNDCIDKDGNITCTPEMEKACVLRWLRSPVKGRCHRRLHSYAPCYESDL